MKTKAIIQNIRLWRLSALLSVIMVIGSFIHSQTAMGLTVSITDAYWPSITDMDGDGYRRYGTLHLNITTDQSFIGFVRIKYRINNGSTVYQYYDTPGGTFFPTGNSNLELVIGSPSTGGELAHNNYDFFVQILDWPAGTTVYASRTYATDSDLDEEKFETAAEDYMPSVSITDTYWPSITDMDGDGFRRYGTLHLDITTDQGFVGFVRIKYRINNGSTVYQYYDTPGGTFFPTGNSNLELVIGSPSTGGELIHNNYDFFVQILDWPAGTTVYASRTYATDSDLDEEKIETAAEDVVPCLSVSPNNQNVQSAPGNTTFNVSNICGGTMTYTSQVSVGSDWLTIQSGGSGGNSGTIIVAFTQNIDCDERIGQITVSAPGATYSPFLVTVTQAGNSTPTLSVTPSNQNVPATGGSTSFNVTNTGCGTMSYSASVSSGSTWLSISTGGAGGNSGTINATCTANTDCFQRVGTITVTASGANGSPISVTVTQAGNTTPTLSVTPSNQNVPATGGSTSFNVTNTGCGTMSYSASVSSGSTWLSISSGGTGGNSGTINATCTANTACFQRVGTIIVTASGANGSPISVTVTQAGNTTPTLSVTPPNQNATASSGVTMFTVSNIGCGSMNYSSSVTSGSNWLSITGGSTGGNSGTITVAYSENPDCLQRIGTITITASGANGSPISVTVTQAGNTTPTLSVTPSNQYVPATGGQTSFSVSNTGCGAMTYQATVTAGSNWLSIVGGSSGGNTGTISVNCTQNTDCNQRVGTITVTASGANGSPFYVTVTQDGSSTPTLSVTPSNQNVSAAQGSTSFNVANLGCGNMSYTSQVTQGSDWLHITSGSGGNGGTIQVNFDENVTTSQRVGTITVTASGASGSPVSVTVTQSPTSQNPILTIEPTTQGVDFDSGTCTFIVSNTGGGNMTYTAEVLPGYQWLTIDQGATGGNNGSIVVHYDENNGELRTGQIKVEATPNVYGSPMYISVVQGAIGIEPNQPTIKIKIYPNPTSGLLTIESDQLLGTFSSISLFSFTGAKVWQCPMISEKKVTFDLGTLPTGVYLLVLRSDKENFIHKIIKMD
jgi:hypothetical protein